MAMSDGFFMLYDHNLRQTAQNIRNFLKHLNGSADFQRHIHVVWYEIL